MQWVMFQSMGNVFVKKKFVGKKHIGIFLILPGRLTRCGLVRRPGSEKQQRMALMNVRNLDWWNPVLGVEGQRHVIR